MSKCSTCGAAIVWAVLKDGQKIPLNYRRTRAYVLDRAPDGQPGADRVVVKLHGGKAADLDLFYVSHFLTCPDASSHSRGKTKAAKLKPATEDASASERRLAEVLDLLEAVEPFFERPGDGTGQGGSGTRFDRVLKAHYKAKGHGCDMEGLRAYMNEKAGLVRALLIAEGRTPFDPDSYVPPEPTS